MNVSFEDTLEPIGIGFGILLVLVGIATIVGMPWTYKSPTVPIGILQVLGALGTIGVGAGLAWLARTSR